MTAEKRYTWSHDGQPGDTWWDNTGRRRRDNVWTMVGRTSPSQRAYAQSLERQAFTGESWRYVEVVVAVRDNCDVSY